MWRGRTSLAIYDLDEETVQHLRERLDAAFTMMRAIFHQPVESSGVEKGASAESSRAIHKSAKEKALEQEKDFEAELGITISDPILIMPSWSKRNLIRVLRTR